MLIATSQGTLNASTPVLMADERHGRITLRILLRDGSASVFVGGSAVSASNGYGIPFNAGFELTDYDGPVYGITNLSGTVTFQVLEIY